MASGPPYASRRSPVLCLHGAVACTQPLAAAAGLRILQQGGNAVDAAVAVAACMAVTEPCSTGVGGDAFALFHRAADRTVHGMNASGRCAAALSLEVARAVAGSGAMELPPRHAHTVTVPGAIAGWCDAVDRWGTMPVSRLLQPAIELATGGFPVAPLTAHHWSEGAAVLLGHQHGSATAPGELLCDGGRGPRAGEVFANPALASVLREVAERGKAAFYGPGRIADAVVGAVAAAGGALSAGDLAAHATEFVDPISTTYGPVRVWEIPPSGQGLVALLALNNLQALPPDFYAAGAGTVSAASSREAAPWCECPAVGPPGGALHSAHVVHSSPSHLHAMIESLRLAFADGRAFIGDPAAVPVPTAGLLDPGYAAGRVAGLRPDRAVADVVAGTPAASSDTVCFAVVDGRGNACSFINSNYMGFGSGIVPTGCGFSLQNRGANFSLSPESPNVLAPGKRPYHTIIPGMATWADTGELHCAFGVMGGYMQPQGHAQVVVNMASFGMDPQTALDAPRVCLKDGTADSVVAVEEGVPDATLQRLRELGHKVAGPVRGWERSLFGRGQILLRDRATGVIWGGSDGRGDGCVMGW